MQGTGHLFLGWINSKPCYFVTGRECWREEVMGEAISNYGGQTNLNVFLNFTICRQYKLTLSEQSQISLQLRVSVSDLVSSFSPCTPCWGARKNFSYGSEICFWRPCRGGRFETTMVVTVIITILLTAAIVTDIWW